MNNGHGLPGLLSLGSSFFLGIWNTVHPSGILYGFQLAGAVFGFIYYLRQNWLLKRHSKDPDQP